jgi:hypothetical protein
MKLKFPATCPIGLDDLGLTKNPITSRRGHFENYSSLIATAGRCVIDDDVRENSTIRHLCIQCRDIAV